MTVKRRLGILRDHIEEFDFKMTVTLVPTLKNKADALTRVKESWLTTEEDDLGEEDVAVCAGAVNLEEIHTMHHARVDCSLFLDRKIDPTVTKQSVEKVVRGCERCQLIDPAPASHEKGEIGVKDNWKRLAIDVTHHRQVAYLSIVNCGPGQFAIWKELGWESADCIASVLNDIFLERGPVEELLMDNATVFRSELLERFLDKWKVRRFFRAAHQPSGNGIVERHRRTIKVMAERGDISSLVAVFWYNMSPRFGQNANSVLAWECGPGSVVCCV